MKLFSWMHQKFRQDSSEPVRISGIGKSSLDDKQYYRQQPKPIRKGHREYSIQNPFASLDPIPEGEEDSSPAISDIFQGFLAIGTLGSDLFTKDLSKVSITVENIKETKTDVTQNDLNLINVELERVPGGEIIADAGNYTSRRNVPFNTTEVTGCNDNESTMCPLQGYHLGTKMEISEKTTIEKEHRTSLEELFEEARVEEESSEAKYKRGDKSVLYRMKKLLRKKMNPTSKRFGGTVDSALAKTKLHDILHMFHNRKVHPEKSGASRKHANDPRKNEMKSHISYDVGYNTGHQILTDHGEDIILIPQSSTSKSTISRDGIQSTQTHFIPIDGDSHESKEHWIKSDIEYLVLELKTKAAN